MAKVKTAHAGEYVITKREDESIKVAKYFDNTKGALREIAEKISFAVDSNWNTRQLGKNLIEQLNGEHVKTNDQASAESGEYVIFKETSGTIQVFKDYDNVKGALREVSEQIGFSYDNNWTTRQFGSKLIDHING